MYSPTKEEIQALKEEHGDIFLLSVEDKCCILKTPNRKILSYATTASQKDPLKFNEVILKNCFVAGDTEIKDDDSYFLSAGKQLVDIIEVKESRLEKL
jgi:acyl-coenzyme A synthetase/AMP-(fatty) acid ligase